MGDCVFCDKPAGVFKSRHKECVLADEQAQQDRRNKALAHQAAQAAAEKIHAEQRQELSLNTYLTIKSGGDLLDLEAQLLDCIVAGNLTHPEMKEMLISAYEQSVDAFLDDGVLDVEEEEKLARCQNRFALSQGEIDRNGKFSRVAKSSILRRVMMGEVPSMVDFGADHIVNFQKGETPVWMFSQCQYLEDTVRRQFVGASQGLSFRVMSGVYYRIGGFKGEPVSTIVRKNLGEGFLVVTDRNLYFVGPGKTTRIPYFKVVSFTPHSDAVGLMRDAATAKPQFFVVDDAWFAYNLITNLAKIHA